MREMKGEGPKKKSGATTIYARDIYLRSGRASPPAPGGRMRPYAAAREGAGVESNSASALKHPSSRQSEV